LFIDLQTCEKFGINPLEYFAGKNEDWLSCKGRSMKILLLAYHQIVVEEDKRIQEEMNKKTKTK
jgi:hypothetical protein